MRKSRFSENQNTHLLKEPGAGTKAGDVCRHLDISIWEGLAIEMHAKPAESTGSQVEWAGVCSLGRRVV